MRSTTSININSGQFRGSNSRDFNFLSPTKISQRLDSRLKSIMPQLKGKQSHIYLTIKVHKSLSDRNSSLIPQVKQQLSNLTNSGNHQQMFLSDFIEWVRFQEPKQLLKDEYLDNELYYIIVPEKMVSWAEAFAKQQRMGSGNNKRIHVLGLLKSEGYKEKLRARSKKRIDKQEQYVHYYSIDNSEISTEICTLISQHLQLKLKHEDEHVKSWALSNKYSHKNVKRRTVHLYFDNEDRSALQSMYKKYNIRSQSSWLQIHPYSSFYEIVKSIKQREVLNIKEAEKANQMAQQLTSRLIKSRSQIDIISMKSISNVYDNSQVLLTSSIQSGAKLNHDDVNVIISRTDFDELDKLVAFVKAQKMRNWRLVQITAGSPSFHSKLAQILEMGNSFESQYQQQREQKIIHSKTLYIIAQSNDEFTKQIFYRQDNIFHNMELILYNDLTEFAILLREGVRLRDNYTLAIVPGDGNVVDQQYGREIKGFMKQYENTDVGDNFTFMATVNGVHVGFISALYSSGEGSGRGYQVVNNDQGWLERILIERDNFFHPFRGLKGANVYLLIKSTKKHLLDDLRQHIGQSQRLHIATYIDKQYLAKQLQNIQIKDSAIVITDDQTLREAQEVLLKFDEVFIMNITKRKNLKEEVKVFAWGDKQRVYDLLKMIPETYHRLQSEIYAETNNKISLTRRNRYLPKNLNFLPGNTISVRLPADLTHQQSRKMEIRLKKYFNEEIKIEYYKDPRDIRLRDKSIEPLTFVILTQKELGYLKTVARKEVEEKRQEFILYDEDPEDFCELIQKKQFERFRLLTNSWEDIECYIIRTFRAYNVVKSQRENLDNSLQRALWEAQNVEDQTLVGKKQVKLGPNSFINTVIKPIMPPAVDIAPYETAYKIWSQPDLSYPTLAAHPKCPFPQAIRNHMGVLYSDSPQFRSLAKMLKSNLEPEQFSVNIIPFRNQLQLQDFTRGNGSKLSNFDNIIVFLSPQYRKYDSILKTMKLKFEPRVMEYFFFDDDFHLKSHQLLAVSLGPHRIRKIRLPWENSNLPKFWNEQNRFNLFVPLTSTRYDSLNSQRVTVLPYSSKQQVQQHIHKAGCFNVIMCDKSLYHVFKEFAKKSPRCILVVDENADLYEDELLFDRYTVYSIYYGPTGVDYLKRVLPKGHSQQQKSSTVKILYHSQNERDLLSNYPDYEKIEFTHNLQLYDHMLVKYGLVDYKHCLLKSSPITQLIPLHPKVYLEDMNYMWDYKNNFAEKGYKHKSDGGASMIKSQLRMHQFGGLHECFYKDHKHLAAMLKIESSPCVVLINESNNKLLGVRQKFSSKHKFVSIVDDSQRWIDKDGYLLQVQNTTLLKKQDLFESLFSGQVFDSFNDFQYYYLSNKADMDRKFNIYFRTKEDLQEIYQWNMNLLMVVFVQSCDKKHIPSVLLQESQQQGSRVKIIYVQSQFVDDDINLYVKFNEIDPVIYHINRIEFSGRRDYVVFREVDGDKKLRNLIRQKNVQKINTKKYETMEDIDRIGDQLKGVYKKIFVICFSREQAQIERIFGLYSIRNKRHQNEALEFFHIDPQLPTINSSISITIQSPAKKHKQKHQLNTISTTPRYTGDMISPKSMKDTYSSRSMKSLGKVVREPSLKSRNLYYQK